MKRYRAPMVALCVIAPIFFAACQQTSSKSSTEWSGPLPDLNKIEECQRADLQRYLGSTLAFTSTTAGPMYRSTAMDG
jgi:hypothetical protein